MSAPTAAPSRTSPALRAPHKPHKSVYEADLFGGRPARQGKSVEWYTPAWVFDAVPARVKLTRLEDGLNRDWAGRVWLNPPYGPDTGRWVARLAAHGDGIAMVFARTDAAWCQAAMQSATAILFMRGRVEFIPGAENRHKRGRCGAATMMLGWGAECATALTRMRDRGVLIER